jgi:hypothetical protein
MWIIVYSFGGLLRVYGQRNSVRFRWFLAAWTLGLILAGAVSGCGQLRTAAVPITRPRRRSWQRRGVV